MGVVVCVWELVLGIVNVWYSETAKRVSNLTIWSAFHSVCITFSHVFARRLLATTTKLTKYMYAHTLTYTPTHLHISLHLNTYALTYMHFISYQDHRVKFLSVAFLSDFRRESIESKSKNNTTNLTWKHVYLKWPSDLTGDVVTAKLSWRTQHLGLIL